MEHDNPAAGAVGFDTAGSETPRVRLDEKQG